MNEKIELSLVQGAMKEAGVNGEQMRVVLEALRAELEANEKEPKPPAPKKQYVLLVSDPLGQLIGKDFAGWVCQIEEGEHPLTTAERIERTAHDYNASKRGRTMPVQTIGETIENAPAKMLKAHGVWAKTRAPVCVVRTSNEIAKVPGILPGQVPFQKLCAEHGASVTVTKGGRSVTVDGNGVRT